MSRPAGERLGDIKAACEAIASYLTRLGADDDTAHSIVRATAVNDIPALTAAVERLLATRGRRTTRSRH